MVLAQHAHHLLRLDAVGEARLPAEIGEEHRDLPAVAAQDRLVPDETIASASCGDRNRRSFRRRSSSLNLRPHALLERAVQLHSSAACLDRVVVALDAEQRPDASEELGWSKGLGMKSSAPASIALVFSVPTLDVTMITGSTAVSSLLAEPSAHGVAVQPRHHDVEQDQVRLRRACQLERCVALGGRDDFVASGASTASSSRTFSGTSSTTRILAGVVAHRAVTPPQWRLTVATSATMSTGFER